jgi:hypothetical protein
VAREPLAWETTGRFNGSPPNPSPTWGPGRSPLRCLCAAHAAGFFGPPPSCTRTSRRLEPRFHWLFRLQLLHLLTVAGYTWALRGAFQQYQRTSEPWLGMGLQDLVVLVLAMTGTVCLLGAVGALRKAFLRARVGHGFLALQCLSTPVALWLAITCGIGFTAKTPGQRYPAGLQTLLVVMMLCEVVRVPVGNMGSGCPWPHATPPEGLCACAARVLRVCPYPLPSKHRRVCPCWLLQLGSVIVVVLVAGVWAAFSTYRT